MNFDFNQYIFVENDPECIKALEVRCHRSPKNKQIHILQGDCNEIIDSIGQHIPQNGLSLVFIDPTKVNIYFETIRKLVYDRRVDLLMNIQDGMDIRRNFEDYKKDGDISRLGKFLGGDVPWEKLSDTKDAIDLYKGRIKKLEYSNVEFKDIVVRNTKNVPMYFLFFASQHPLGLKFWNEITKKDEQGQYELF